MNVEKYKKQKKCLTKGKVYGPYPNSKAAKDTVDLLNRIYPLRKCNHIPKKECLYYHIGQCLGPCIKTVDQQLYQNIEKKITNILKGNVKEEIKNNKEFTELSMNEETIVFNKEAKENIVGYHNGDYNLNLGDKVKIVGNLNELKSSLKNKKGALLIGSHLGNIELLRSLSSFGEHGVSHAIPVTTIMELKATEMFNRTLHEINPEVDIDVINPTDINLYYFLLSFYFTYISKYYLTIILTAIKKL